MPGVARIILGLLALLGVVVAIVWLAQRQDAVVVDAPTADTPTTNAPTTETVAGRQPASTKPTFVGRQICKECHADNFRLHAQHGHASTLARAEDSPVAEKFAGHTFDAGPPYGRYRYELDNGQLVAKLPEKFGEDPFPLQYAFGSGHNAITLFSLVPDPDGGTQAIEHRVSWFHSGDELSLTPGHADKVPIHGAEFFGDAIKAPKMRECVSCHSTTGEIVDQQIVGLVPNVNCEKCHGPGSEHVRLARQTKTPPPFSVGKRDWDTEAEMKLCGSCHRLPEHMTAKELREYPISLIRFQPVGLLRSPCYLESAGQLRCTTCHNPHTTSKATTTAQYIQICVNCHLPDSETHVACPVSPQDDCIGCHMPPLNFIRDVTFHDHWIRVRDDQPATK